MTTTKTTDQKIKELEQALDGVKLDSEDKERLREIYDKVTNSEEQNKQLHVFLKELAVKTKKQGYAAKKSVQKVAPLYDTHDFWDSEPVPKVTDEPKEDDFDKSIDVDKKVDEIRADPLDIPPGFTWCNVNIEDDVECGEVYDLLTQNYVEDDDNMFRFDYSVKFL